MKQGKGSGEKFPLYSAEDFFAGKKDAKPVGWCSDPDRPGPLMVDFKTLQKLCEAGKEIKKS